MSVNSSLNLSLNLSLFGHLQINRMLIASVLVVLICGNSAVCVAESKAVQEAATGDKSIKIITRVVGEAGERVVTSREVQINDAVEQAMSGRALGATGYRVLSGEEKNFSAEVTSVLLEWVVYLEAQGFTGAVRGDPSKALKQVNEIWTGHASWSGLEASADEIKEIITRKLAAKEFIRLKTDSSLVPVTDIEAETYFKKNRLKFGNLPFESFRDNIKAFLIKQQTDRRLKDWFEVLQRRYKVRNFIAG